MRYRSARLEVIRHGPEPEKTVDKPADLRILSSRPFAFYENRHDPWIYNQHKDFLVLSADGFTAFADVAAAMGQHCANDCFTWRGAM